LGGALSPLPTSYGVWRSVVSSPSKTPKIVEFGAFWDTKIASKSRNVAKKLYENV